MSLPQLSRSPYGGRAPGIGQTRECGAHPGLECTRVERRLDIRHPRIHRVDRVDVVMPGGAQLAHHADRLARGGLMQVGRRTLDVPAGTHLLPEREQHFLLHVVAQGRGVHTGRPADHPTHETPVVPHEPVEPGTQWIRTRVVGHCAVGRGATQANCTVGVTDPIGP